MKKEFEATINLTQMDREAVDYFTMSEILETYPDVSGVIINELEYDYSASVFYAHTGLGRVIFPRHLNETLEDIDDIMDGCKEARFAFHPYSYTFGDRHGYSAKFYIIDNIEYKRVYSDTDSFIANISKEPIGEKISTTSEVKYDKCTYNNVCAFKKEGFCHAKYLKDCNYRSPNPYQE